MKLYEYMGKDLFAQYGIPVPKGKVTSSPEEAAKLTKEIGDVVIKSQVLTGKRGKAGGICFTNDPAEAEKEAKKLLEMQIHGFQVEKILVEEKLQIDKELYLSITVDGSAKKPVLLASREGGMDIEEVPEDLMVRLHIDSQIGLQPFMAREVNRKLGLKGDLAKQVNRILQNLYRLFLEKDTELVEINPLVISGDKIIAADAKVTIDDDALYRQKSVEIVEEKTATEKKAQDIGLAYVELDGNIAVMANGAGITMATLDLIQHFGGNAANFMDAGGGASEEQMGQAVELLLSTNPKSIMINIFGGITRCDDVANAFISVKNKRDIPVPVVIRLVGTNDEKGRKILEENGIKAFETMHEAAVKVVELSKSA